MVPPAYAFEQQIFKIEKPKVVDGVERPRQSLVVQAGGQHLNATILTVGRIAGNPPLTVPFIHLTLATKPDTDIAARGIGIATREEWESLNPVPYNNKPWLEAYA